MNQKINKHIEIVVLSKELNCVAQHQNIGTNLNTKIISGILNKVYENVFISVINTKNELELLVAKKPDLVFSGIKYFCFNQPSNGSNLNIWLTDYLDKHNIAYIGSNRKALLKEYDKSCAKKIISEFNINTAPFFTTQPDEYITMDSIPIAFPLFIKPNTGGGSEGIDLNSFVNNLNGLHKKVRSIFINHHTSSLVETYLSGSEYSVGIFEDHLTGCLTAMPIEIIANKNKNGHRILDFNVKKMDTETVHKITNLKVRKLIVSLATSAFKALGGQSYGRIDIKMDAHGIPHFVEANFMPGLEKGYFYRACLINQKMTYEHMIIKIAEIGLSSKNISPPENDISPHNRRKQELANFTGIRL